MGAQHTITAGSEPRVPLDIKALKQSEGRPLIEPRDIFAALGGRPWPRLRVEQDQVLKSWGPTPGSWTRGVITQRLAA